jgi:hypothetical protein
VYRYVGWDNVLPFSALVLELAGIAAHVRGHASPAGVSVPIVVVVVVVFPRMGSNSLHAQVACAENIHPLQSETCKHLHAPPPEPADCD